MLHDWKDCRCKGGKGEGYYFEAQIIQDNE